MPGVRWVQNNEHAGTVENKYGTAVHNWGINLQYAKILFITTTELVGLIKH